MSLSLVPLMEEKTPSATEIDLAGVVGTADASALRRMLKRILQQGYKAVVVDMQRVVDIDGECWNFLVSAARRLRRQGGQIVLWHCPLRILGELQLRQWDRCFLFPEHRPGDMALLPIDVQGWLRSQLT